MSRPLTRLTNAMMWQGALSRGEATAGIAAHRRGDPYGGSEAVAHYGGPTKLISDVMRNPAARKYGRQYSDLRQND